MSYGLVICSTCKREVHQTGDRSIKNGWIHCESQTPICDNSAAVYPTSKAQIVGQYCGVDEMTSSEVSGVSGSMTLEATQDIKREKVVDRSPPMPRIAKPRRLKVSKPERPRAKFKIRKRWP